MRLFGSTAKRWEKAHLERSDRTLESAARGMLQK